MTIRQLLTRRKRLMFIAAVSGFVAMLGGCTELILFHGHTHYLDVDLAAPLLFLGALVLFVSFLAGRFVLRCPRCKGALGSLLTATGTPLSVSRKVRFCAYCGESFDSESRAPEPRA